ncbi:MAG: alkane 1-monooxygenase [Pseudomonadota bacterium]
MIRFCGPFIFLAAIPLLYIDVGPAAPLIAIVTLAAILIAAELVAQRGEWAAPSANESAFRLLPYLYIPLQLGLIAWATSVVSRATTPTIGFVSLVLSVGVTTGIFGVLSAHEMVHSPRRAEQALGAALLTGMSYRHFRIAHIHGHHRYAGSARDPGSARFGENFYAFLLRTFIAQIADAYAFEKRRAAGRWWENGVIHDAVLMVLLAGGLVAFGGWRTLAFFGAQSAVAIIVLELFNYIAHYGLARETRADGRLEPFADHHSWNSSNVVSNALLFNMGRHSDHHRRATAPYQHLRYAPGAPELPAGYVGSVLMALAPPLWRSVMDPKVRALRTAAAKAAA